MSRTTHLGFLCLAVFLVLFTGTAGKPGLPPTLKADEPAYLLMALSLIEDGDVRCDEGDFTRLLDTYPYMPAENLIVMSDDDWRTVYFGKPYIYPMIASPFVAVFGSDGLVAFNALLFVLMIWCGAHYLRHFNRIGTALLYSALFFALSPTWSYVFWLQPEIFNMASVCFAYFLALGRFDFSRWARWTNPLSAVALSLGVYNKPVLAAFALPLAYAIWRRADLRRTAVWLGILIASGLALAGGSVALTGHPSAYLGVARAGIKVESPEQVAELLATLPRRLAVASTTANSWSWVFRAPPTTLPEVRQSIGYFFWGRHTGMLLYLPFAVVSLALFLLHRRHRPEGWLTLAATALIALFFICVIPLNWHGGGGFVGNRYFIMAYPAFLFLVTKVRPLWLTLPGAAAGGLFLGTILATPYGASVPLPTLQAHARNDVFSLFPLEITLRKTVPGYSVFSYRHLALMGRKDRLMPHRERGGLPWVQARVPVEITVLTDRLIQGLFFEVSTFTPDNEIELEFAGAGKRLRFENATTKGQKARVVELQPLRPPRTHWELGKSFYVYDMNVRVARGQRIFDKKMPVEVFYAGAQLEFVGRRDQITRPEHYRVDWLAADAPSSVPKGDRFAVIVRLRNSSASPFASTGPIPVNLAYRWLAGDGSRLATRAERTRFAEPLEPGQELETRIEVLAPDAAGEYQLALDLVRENVGWFSDVAAQAKMLSIRVE